MKLFKGPFNSSLNFLTLLGRAFCLVVLASCNQIIVTELAPPSTTVLDTASPADQGANIQFTDVTDADGNDIAMTWTPFSDDVAVTNHRIRLYTDNACSAGLIDLGLTGSASAVDNGIVDGIPVGTYYATVTAYDAAGNFTTSSCSSDSVTVAIPSIPPVDNGANLQFTDATDKDGNDIAVTWTPFSDDVAVTNHRIRLYTDNSCSTGLIDLGFTGSASAIDTGIVDGIPSGTYYATVTAYDADNNSTTSSCSTDSIVRSTLISEMKIKPVDLGAGDNFSNGVSLSGNRAIAGSPLDDDKGTNAGAVYIYELDSTSGTWSETKITATDGIASAKFGIRVSIHGNTAIVGASGVLSSRGSAYILQYNSATQLWDETKLLSSDGVANDFFGASVAIYGNNAIVGAALDDDKGSASGAAYIYQYNPVTKIWAETKLVPSDGAAADYFGNFVAISNNMALVSAQADDDKGADSGSAYLYYLNPNTKAWEFLKKITASDGVAGDQFSTGVSLSGNTAVAGAFRKNSNSGAVYIYSYNPQSKAWDESKVTASDAVGNLFGYSFAIEGKIILIGAPYDDSKAPDAGAVYVFQFDPISKTWGQVEKITASDGANTDILGGNIATSGNMALISAAGDDDKGADAGAVYLINDLPGSLSSSGEAKLVASDSSANSQYGQSVSIFGTTAVVGSPNTVSSYVYQYNANTGVWDETKLVPASGTGITSFGQIVTIYEANIIIGASDSGQKGSVYIYQFRPDTAGWLETQILASDGANSDKFGASVDISGNTALVGAPGKNAAYLYQLDTLTNTWVEVQKVTSVDAGFGFSVSISGSSAVIGADVASTASLYQYNPATTTWIEVQKLTSGEAASEAFGSSVSIFNNSILVGAPFLNSNTGAAYLFEYNPTSQIWDKTKTFTATDGASGDKFGSAVGLFQNTVIIGAPEDDDKGSNAGAIYLFNYSGNVWNQKSKITVKEGTANHTFGTSVDIWGNSAIAGAPFSSTGSAYLISVD